MFVFAIWKCETWVDSIAWFLANFAPMFLASSFCFLFIYRLGKPWGALPRSSSPIPSPISASSSYLQPPPFAWTAGPTPWPITSQRISFPSPPRGEGPTWPLSGSMTFRGPKGAGRRSMPTEWTGCSWPLSGPPTCSWRTFKSASCSGYSVGNSWERSYIFLHGILVRSILLLFLYFLHFSEERGSIMFSSWVRKFFQVPENRILPMTCWSFWVFSILFGTCLVSRL